MYNVPELVTTPDGGTLEWIEDINNNGWMVGYMQRGKEERAVLLRPVGTDVIGK